MMLLVSPADLKRQGKEIMRGRFVVDIGKERKEKSKEML